MLRNTFPCKRCGRCSAMWPIRSLRRNLSAAAYHPCYRSFIRRRPAANLWIIETSIRHPQLPRVCEPLRHNTYIYIYIYVFLCMDETWEHSFYFFIWKTTMSNQFSWTKNVFGFKLHWSLLLVAKMSTVWKIIESFDSVKHELSVISSMNYIYSGLGKLLLKLGHE